MLTRPTATILDSTVAVLAAAASRLRLPARTAAPSSTNARVAPAVSTSGLNVSMLTAAAPNSKRLSFAWLREVALSAMPPPLSVKSASRPTKASVSCVVRTSVLTSVTSTRPILIGTVSEPAVLVAFAAPVTPPALIV